MTAIYFVRVFKGNIERWYRKFAENRIDYSFGQYLKFAVLK